MGAKLSLGQARDNSDSSRRHQGGVAWERGITYLKKLGIAFFSNLIINLPKDNDKNVYNFIKL